MNQFNKLNRLNLNKNKKNNYKKDKAKVWKIKQVLNLRKLN